MSPNPINFIWFGDIHGPKTHKFVGFRRHTHRFARERSSPTVRGAEGGGRADIYRFVGLIGAPNSVSHQQAFLGTLLVCQVRWRRGRPEIQIISDFMSGETGRPAVRASRSAAGQSSLGTLGPPILSDGRRLLRARHSLCRTARIPLLVRMKERVSTGVYLADCVIM
jgi:hypothetical protein